MRRGATGAPGPHTGTLATVTDTGGGTGPYFSDLVWDDGAGNVENVVFMRIRGYTNHGLRTAWTLAEKPAFRASESRDFLAEGTDYDTLGGQLTPAANTDYRANTKRDGSGDDITAQVSVSYPDTATYNGKGTLVRVAFGATAGYLTLLRMRTLNAITYDDPVILRADDAASRRAHGDRTRSIEARWTRESDTALAAIRSRLKGRKEPRTVLRLTVANGVGGQPGAGAPAGGVGPAAGALPGHGDRRRVLRGGPRHHGIRGLDGGEGHTAAA